MGLNNRDDSTVSKKELMMIPSDCRIVELWNCGIFRAPNQQKGGEKLGLNNDIADMIL